jgi:adenylate cyclase
VDGGRGSAPSLVGGAVTDARALFLSTDAGPIGLNPGANGDTAGLALVVDDSAVNRKLLGQLLAGIGIATVEATDGAAALSCLRDGSGQGVDVVLLDVMMPELDGYETLAAIKSDAALRHLPVIMISGVDELDSVVRCIELGAADYLPKPFDPALLRARVNASLAAKRLHDLEVEYVGRLAALNETVERQKQELTRFLSPQVAALVSSSEGEQLLAGHRREITVAFADLRGFTAFAQQAEPEELLGVLSEYHTMMGHAIVEFGGTLEHFAGDGMMVFFNDPIQQADHVERAVRMAVAMRERFEGLAQGWRKRGFELHLGVGIATGYATLGRIGFEGRYDYGAIGNVVILASRLSSEARAGQILLAQRSQAAVEELVDTEPVGELTLKGFAQPVPAANVTALRDGEAPVATDTGR